MEASSAAHSTTPRTRTAPQRSPTPDGDPFTINFGTVSELAPITTPPTAKTIPAVTPSLSLAERAKESMRLARERQVAESARRPPRPPKSTKNVPSRWNNAPITPSVSKPRAQTATAFNPSRSRASTPVQTHRPSTPTNPSSRHSRTRSNASLSASPKTTPKSINATPSTAVRDAIAKAKEAHRQKVQRTPPVARRIDYTDDTSFDDIDNPFNVAPGTPPLEAQLRRAIETGRTTGTRVITTDKRQSEHFQSRTAVHSGRRILYV
jgi:hypothetical protein